MSRPKHTPGGWSVFDSDVSGLSVNADNECKRVCDVARNPSGADRANARLISAAPEMLNALKTAHVLVCNLIDDKNLSSEGLTAKEYDDYKNWVGQIQEAIRKAEGREVPEPVCTTEER